MLPFSELIQISSIFDSKTREITKNPRKSSHKMKLHPHCTLIPWSKPMRYGYQIERLQRAQSKTLTLTGIDVPAWRR